MSAPESAATPQPATPQPAAAPRPTGTPLQRALEEPKTRLWIVWGASTAVTPIFGVLGYLATRDGVEVPPPTSFQVTLSAAGVLIALLSTLAPRMMLSKKALIGHMRNKEKPIIRTIPSEPGLLESLSPRELRLYTLSDLHFRAFKLGYGTSVLIPLVGFAYLMVTGQLLPFVGFAVGALVVQAINWPALDALIARTRKLVPEPRAPAPTALPMGPRNSGGFAVSPSVRPPRNTAV